MVESSPCVGLRLRVERRKPGDAGRGVVCEGRREVRIGVGATEATLKNVSRVSLPRPAATRPRAFSLACAHLIRRRHST